MRIKEEGGDATNNMRHNWLMLHKQRDFFLSPFFFVKRKSGDMCGADAAIHFPAHIKNPFAPGLCTQAEDKS
jgi:hypothetical protein